MQKVIVVALVFLGACRAAFAGPVAIVSPGHAPRVLAAPGQVNIDAAADLCDYLSRVTGQHIAPGAAGEGGAVTIHVGPDAFTLQHVPEVAKLFGDGFIIRHVAEGDVNHLILAGTRWDATRWAVERFLHDYCGVRWLSREPEYGEVVPKRETISIAAGLNAKHEPDYLGRSNAGMYMFDRSRKYLRLGPSGLEFGSHGIQFIFDGEDFEAHPEWFAFFNGKRQWWPHGNGWQICLSNPETVDHAVEYVRDFFRNNPDAPIISMGQNDGDGWCQCPLCAQMRARETVKPAYTQGEEWWLWLNKVAERVAKIYPDKTIECMAYETPAQPPRFALSDNIAVTVTVYVPEHLNLAERWLEKVRSVNLYSYPYGTTFYGFRHYPHAMRDFLKWGHDKLHAVGHVAECGGDWSFDGPKYAYIQALQWDVNADPDAVMREYCQAAYGPAAETMGRFWKRLEEIYERRDKDLRLVFYAVPAWKDRLPPGPADEFRPYRIEDIGVLDRIIAESERRAAKDPADAFRVARVADAWRFFRTLVASKLKFSNRLPEQLAAVDRSRERALATAREIAGLRARRDLYFNKLRTFPETNPRLVVPNYWVDMTAETVFGDEKYLLDYACSVVTTKLGKNKAGQFWQAIAAGDPLYEAAQTQLYMLRVPNPANRLRNAGFESGDLNGWTVHADGLDQILIPPAVLAQMKSAIGEVKRDNLPIGIVNEARTGRSAAYMSGRGSAALSQQVPVSPGERYHLSAWGRYMTTAPQDAVPLEAVITFQNKGKTVACEPTRSLARTTEIRDGWVRIDTAVTVPPTADSAEITLKRVFARGPGTVLWDDASLLKVKDGPKTVPGMIVESFSDPALPGWYASPVGTAGKTPRVGDGALVLADETMGTLVSFSSFDDLFAGEGRNRYRLRLHVAPGANEAAASSLEWGIKANRTAISTADTGLFFMHTVDAGKPGQWRMRAYAHQNAKWLGSADYDSSALKTKGAGELWYTLYFGPNDIEVFASPVQPGASDGVPLGKFEHKITDLTSQGSVFLKVSGRNIRLDEISLSKPAG